MTMDTELGALPTLTPNQTAFVHALLQGDSASDAYREAYDCKISALRRLGGGKPASQQY